MPKLFAVILISLGAVPLWSQTDSPPSQPPVPAMVGVNSSSAPAESYNPDTSGDRMMTPPPVSGQAYPVTLSFGRAVELFAGRAVVYRCVH